MKDLAVLTQADIDMLLMCASFREEDAVSYQPEDD